MKHTDIMLDLETLGTGNDAAIMAIGAVAFSVEGRRKGNESLFDRSPEEQMRLPVAYDQAFSSRIDLSKTPEAVRGEIDPATVEWWLKQTDEARALLVSGQRDALDDALYTFVGWAQRFPGCRLWANGPTFDITILRSAFRRARMVWPFAYNADRCCRTLYEVGAMFGMERKSLGCADDIVKHDALGDAVLQARHMVLIAERLMWSSIVE